MREHGNIWIHEDIDIVDARDVVVDVPQPSADDMQRLTRPEAFLTLAQLDRFPVERVLGRRAAAALGKRL